MLWAVLATVVSTSSPAANIASTYDEAACAEAQAEKPLAVELGEINCSEPPPAVPAVLDCNDVRVSVWLGEMIGSCDMPSPPRPTGGPGAVRAGGNSGSDPRLCVDGRCGVDAAPIRPLARGFDDLTPALLSARPDAFRAEVTDLNHSEQIARSQIFGSRLERPPRSR